MGLLSSIASLALKPSVAIGNLITAGVEKVTGKDYGRTTSQQLASTTAGKALGLGIAATGAALLVTTGAAAKAVKVVAPKVASTAIAHPLATASGVLVGAPLLTGVISKKPELVTELPKKSFETGQGLVDIISEHPIASGAVASVTGGVAAYEVGKAIFGKGETVIENNIPEVSAATTPALEAIPSASLNQTPVNPSQNIPTTPQTVSIAPKKRYKKRKVATSPIFRNNVHIEIDNKPVGMSNKRYLRQVIYN